MLHRRDPAPGQMFGVTGRMSERQTLPYRITSGLPVILPQLRETMFVDLLQSLLRSSNQGHSTLLQLCYSLRNHSTSCSRVALPFARLTSDS